MPINEDDSIKKDFEMSKDKTDKNETDKNETAETSDAKMSDEEKIKRAMEDHQETLDRLADM